MTDTQWPYSLPIWRRCYESASPDRTLIARINPAYEVSMGAPTSGLLCISTGLHIDRCNPSFVWSDDSRYLAVPQFFQWLGPIRRQRLLVISFAEHRVYSSHSRARFFQPESFAAGQLMVSIDPFRSRRTIQFAIPADLQSAFRYKRDVDWPEPYKLS